MPRILIVDDEPDICHNLADILGEFGYAVDACQTAAEAVSCAERDAYDVALLDLRMPDISGIELYQKLKKLQPAMVAILVTAFAEEAVESRALGTGFQQIVSKPVDLPELVKLVQSAADQPMVLIVDDDEDLCATIWDTLRDQRFRVGIAHRPQEALQQLQRHDYQVVLLDLKLPDGDSRQVFKQLRQADPPTRTLLITGFPAEMETSVNELLRDGADAVCFKPFHMPQLLELVQRLSSDK